MSSISKTRDLTAHIVNLNAVNPAAPTGHTQAPGTGAEDAKRSATKPSINLFDRSSYQAQTPVTLTDGQQISLPSLSAEEASAAQALFAGVPQEHRDALNAASAELGAALMASGSNTIVGGGSKLASSSGANSMTVNQASPGVASAVANASSAYSQALTPSYGSNSGAKNYDDTVQAVAFMGVLGLQNEMGTYAQGLQATQNRQNVLRADQSELQTAVNSWGDDVSATQNFTWHEVDGEGNLVSKSGDLNKSQAQGALNNVGSALASYTDQTQLQVLQLQNMTQNYQNGINTISNLMKAAYDTTKNTLGNIHY